MVGIITMLCFFFTPSSIQNENIKKNIKKEFFITEISKEDIIHIHVI
jgi:hypothetical protein